MEKIVIGVPYEISIEPSIDIGKFDAELVIIRDDFQIGVELKRIKGKDIDYTFTVPSKLKSLLKKYEVGYSIFVYKENARFEVDDGKLKFIDESDFEVKVKDDVKMRRVEDEKPKPTKKAKKKVSKKPEPTPTPSEAVEERYVDPAAAAQALIDAAAQQESVVEHVEFDDIGNNIPPVPSVNKPAATPGNLGSILDTIETRKSNRAERDRVNENIRKAINKTKT